MSRGGRKKNRRHFKVEQLACRQMVDQMLTQGYTYEDIVAAVRSEGETITVASLSRYHGSFERIAERITKTREQMQTLIEAVRDRPNTDLAEAANQLMMQGLLQRVATAEDEFDSLPLDKAGRLVANLERSAVQREKLKFEFDKGVSAATEKIRAQLQDELKSDPELLARLAEIVERAKTELTS